MCTTEVLIDHIDILLQGTIPASVQNKSCSPVIHKAHCQRCNTVLGSVSVFILLNVKAWVEQELWDSPGLQWGALNMTYQSGKQDEL